MVDQAERIFAELERTCALLEELYPQITGLVCGSTLSAADLAQAKAEAVRLIDGIERQTAELQTLQKEDRPGLPER